MIVALTRKERSARNKAKYRSLKRAAHSASKKRLYVTIGRQHGISFDSRGVIRRDSIRSKEWPIGRPI